MNRFPSEYALALCVPELHWLSVMRFYRLKHHHETCSRGPSTSLALHTHYMAGAARGPCTSLVLLQGKCRVVSHAWLQLRAEKSSPRLSNLCSVILGHGLASSSHSLGLLTQQLLRLWVVHQNLIQVLLIQNEKICKSMSDNVCCSPISSSRCQQAE